MQFSKAYFVMTYYLMFFWVETGKKTPTKRGCAIHEFTPTNRWNFFLVKAKPSVSTKYLHPKSRVLS